jgi:hypothetical protein
MRLKNSFYLLILMLLFNCKNKKEEILPATKYEIEKTLAPFMKSFLYEADLRNIKIDTTNLILRFSTKNTILQEACGTCSQNLSKPSVQKIIEINSIDSICWQYLSNNSKEELIFHELGHCILARFEHKNDLFADGSPKSIMYKSNSDLYAPCTYDISGSNDCNRITRRKYYIDELFDPKTPTPLWAK